MILPAVFQFISAFVHETRDFLGYTVPVPRRLSRKTSQRYLRTTGLVAGLVVLSSACSRVPEIEDQLTQDLRGQPYPQLLPLSSALPPQENPAELSSTLDEELAARAARLKRRAAALKERKI